MARSYSAKGANASTSSVATSAFTSQVGDIIVVVVGAGSGPRTVTGISDSLGNTFTAQPGNPQAPNGQFNIYCWVAKVTTANASHVVTATLSGAGLNFIGVIGLTGRDQTTPVAFVQQTLEGANTTSHSSAATGALSVSGCDMVCVFGDNVQSQLSSSVTYTATSTGWTMDASGTTTTGATTATGGIMYRENVDTSSQTATYTNSGGSVRAANWILAIAPAAVAGNANLTSGKFGKLLAGKL